MPALPLDQLQITHKDPKTGKRGTSAALWRVAQHNASSAPGPTPDHPQRPEDRKAEDFSSTVHPEQKADRYFVLYKPPPKDNIPALVEE
ncbi:Activating signal cointegrator 1 complex subunit 2 [Apodemus speciosus]|uniref:Activating signal cointegrator 1 complex subunit 2 n=1 Tax=Apodemus speciosus TaxID=105296 RepID=A0ABQ0F904_APOSI